jgi:hypothetical protein
MMTLADYKPEVRDAVARLAFERDAARRAYDALNLFDFIDEHWQWVGTPSELEAWRAAQREWIARLDAWRAVALQPRNLLPQEARA